jgi:hypothetical protein
MTSDRKFEQLFDSPGRGRIFWRAAISILLGVWATSFRAQGEPQIEYERLPQEVKAELQEIRKSCKELDPEFVPHSIDQGIDIVKLDGSTAIILNAEYVCNSRMAGGNCTNHECDLKIWKQTGKTSWKKIFDEPLYRSFISIDENNRLKLIAASIYAGDSRCKPNPKKDYPYAQSCDVLITYRNNDWIWNKIQ